MLRSRHIPTIALLVLLGLLLGCGGGEEGEPTGTQTGSGFTETTAAETETTVVESGSAEPVLIGWASPIDSNPGIQGISHGQRVAAEQLGLDIKVLDADLSADKQLSDIDTFINLGARGIITWTLDPGALEGVYSEAVAQGIKIVGYASPASQFSTTVYPEQYAGSELADKAALYIADRIPNAKVLVIGPPPVPDLIRYTEFFVERAKARGLEVLERQDNVGDTAQSAQPLVETMLSRHPDAQAIWSFNDPGALGAGATVLNQGGKVWQEGVSEEGVIIIGTIGAAEAAEGIKTGAMTATFDQNGPVVGAKAVEALAVALGKAPSMTTPPEKVVIRATLYDATNIDEWLPPLERDVKVDFQFDTDFVTE